MLYRILPAVPEHEWREPSLARPKDSLGNQNRTRFRLAARLNDGFIRWQGWFDSREDADAFLWALAQWITMDQPVSVELWRLPTPWWHPDIGPDVSYEFATFTYLTTPTGSNQTFTSPTDWNNASNTVDVVAPGGSGGTDATASVEVATGAGGGEWRQNVNFSFATPGTTTAVWEIDAAGTAVTSVHGASASGVDGANAWFNGANIGASSVGAMGGDKGVAGTAGGLGGTGGVGTNHNNGGAGGNVSGSFDPHKTPAQASGGGGAAGSTGAGSAGAWYVYVGSNGGAGDAGVGGVGGAGKYGDSATGVTGSAGAEWDSSHGSGGGGGAATALTGTARGGAGGSYGAGGGAAAAAAGSAISGAGGPGIIVLKYLPLLAGSVSNRFFELFG